ncbi:sugar ABC transporter, permease protein [Streptomyces bingchenggensis BCW-1]|uniref:Sugar ABC transporter, permease protein n=1 Tax=Streptomyces bingchenggensis (strain BCW-1) TaxID=749414 RepID=D7CH76_STRBB|nr:MULTISPECIES: ABC transporter permease [Streptomyces]ADI04911.1 sugar ABC transporter, permease protein [Streptomyces bingchenggensis BCW-1]
MANATLAAPDRDTWPTRLRDIGFWADWAALVGLIVLVVVFQAANPTFLSTGNIQSMLEAAAILIILGVGQTFVIATAGIDLSIASIMTLGAVGFGQAYSAGWGLAASCAVAVAASTLAGLLNGFVVARGKITDFIVTLGMLSAASGLALIVSNGKPVTVIEPALLKLSTNGIGILGWMFIIAAAVAIVAHVVLFHTRFGTHLLATGGSPESATAMGISTARIKIGVYAVAGLLAGLASILLVARVGAAEPAANTSFLLNSVAAVVLGGVSLFGGRATVIGPVIGALLLTALVNGLTLLGVSQFYQPLSVGIVVVLAAFLMRFQR